MASQYMVVIVVMMLSSVFEVLGAWEHFTIGSA
jgi:hypothetical protein